MTEDELRRHAATLYEALRERLQSDGFDGGLSVTVDPDHPGGLRVEITGTVHSVTLVPGVAVTDPPVVASVVEQLTRHWTNPAR